MQNVSPLMALLQLMENPFIVALLVVVMIAIRIIWAKIIKTPHGATTPAKNFSLEVIDTIIIALILVFGIVRPFLLQTYFIPSDSMVSTLKKDDKLIANKFVYRFRAPKRGEVIVFTPPVEAIVGTSYDLMLRQWVTTHPHQLSPDEMTKTLAWMATMHQANPDSSSITSALVDQAKQLPPQQLEAWVLAVLPQPHRDDFIKRVIGEPGDHIRISDGCVYVNGKALDEPYLDYGTSTQSYGLSTPPSADFLNPGERPHLIVSPPIQGMQIEQSDFGANFLTYVRGWYFYNYLYKARLQPHLQGDEFVVPRGTVLAMGDNRGNSFDGRWWGPEPIKDIKARAISTFWPLNRLKLL